LFESQYFNSKYSLKFLGFGIKLPDAIILATAKVLNVPLLTDDWDDFSNIDETIVISNIDFLKI